MSGPRNRAWGSVLQHLDIHRVNGVHYDLSVNPLSTSIYGLLYVFMNNGLCNFQLLWLEIKKHSV